MAAAGSRWQPFDTLKPILTANANREALISSYGNRSLQADRKVGHGILSLVA
jgi:hypothetical protein